MKVFGLGMTRLEAAGLGHGPHACWAHHADGPGLSGQIRVEKQGVGCTEATGAELRHVIVVLGMVEIGYQKRIDKNARLTPLFTY